MSAAQAAPAAMAAAVVACCAFIQPSHSQLQYYVSVFKLGQGCINKLHNAELSELTNRQHVVGRIQGCFLESNVLLSICVGASCHALHGGTW